MIRLLLVDDHHLVRSGMLRLLSEETDFDVVAEAANGEDAVQLARELVPDVVLMDINMPGIGGLEATRRILQQNPDTKIIVVSMYQEEPYPNRLLEAGAMGYLSKDSAADEVVTAVRQVAAGKNYVASEIASRLAISLIKGSGGSPFDTLSQREMQVAMMVTQGHSTQAISDSLCLSPKTVSTYRYRLFEKLDVHNDVGLTRMAMRYGLLEDAPQQSSA
ncbi:MAG: UvrY/SirA/GacA family response regulator transcription factor [Salinisphaera sp.]|nr:UvrY/SirA/GacA family response regulator transcription factor [Salinisphaera sp.]